MQYTNHPNRRNSHSKVNGMFPNEQHPILLPNAVTLSAHHGLRSQLLECGTKGIQVDISLIRTPPVSRIPPNLHKVSLG